MALSVCTPSEFSEADDRSKWKLIDCDVRLGHRTLPVSSSLSYYD